MDFVNKSTWALAALRKSFGPCDKGVSAETFPSTPSSWTASIISMVPIHRRILTPTSIPSPSSTPINPSPDSPLGPSPTAAPRAVVAPPCSPRLPASPHPVPGFGTVTPHPPPIAT